MGQQHPPQHPTTRSRAQGGGSQHHPPAGQILLGTQEAPDQVPKPGRTGGPEQPTKSPIAQPSGADVPDGGRGAGAAPGEPGRRVRGGGGLPGGRAGPALGSHPGGAGGAGGAAAAAGGRAGGEAMGSAQHPGPGAVL